MVVFFSGSLHRQEVLIEAESFDNSGGWKIELQFEQQMGSPNLLTNCIGEPVNNATTKVKFESP